MSRSYSPRSSVSSPQVVQLARDLGVMSVLASSSKGQLKYDTGWDQSPHSFFKLVAEVQMQDELRKSRVLESAYQITIKDKSHSHLVEDSEDQSSTTSSVANEFFNNDYYESETSSQSITPLPSPGRSVKRVTFLDNLPKASALTSKLSDENENVSRTSTPQTLRNSTGTSPQRSSAELCSSIKRGLGIREEQYDDEETARGFDELSPIFTSVTEAIFAMEEAYKGQLENRNAQRSHKMREDRESYYDKSIAMISQLQREKDQSRQRREEKVRKSLEKLKQDHETFKIKQRMEREKREKLKQAQEAEHKKILEDFKKKEEEIVAAAAAAAKAEQERLEREKKLKEAEEDKKRADEAAALAAKAKEAAEQKAAEEAKAKSIPPSQKGYEVPPEFQGYILPADLQRYLKSQQVLAEYKEKFSHISASGAKEYYSSALKAVNTTLNSIANSPAHIKSKVDQLVNLLQGKPVYLGDSSGSSFTATSQPQGQMFVSNLLAFRFVKKSESEISKGHTSIEPLATLGVMVVTHFPDWAVLVRANFYKMCPFLVPFSFPRNDKTVEEYALAMGHQLGGSESAVRQALLDKMTGYCTLYAMMVRILERDKIMDVGETTEFFSLREVWRILVATMKLKPQLDMTATVIQILLDNLGDRLSAVYGSQFKKLVQFLLSIYLPEIRRETPAGKTAALTRLELFLETKLQKGFSNF